MSENLEDLTPNQRRALNKGLAALETMAAMWGAEIRIHDVARNLAAKPEADRAKSIAAFIEQAFIEGAYRHYLDRDPAANPELERASQPGSGEKHVDDIIERLKNPMTPYGMVVRAFRIATGATLMQMANYLGISPAQLSGMEHGRKPVTRDDAANAAGFFASLGMAPTLHVLLFALANADAARASLDGRREG